ncbi:Retrotransposon 4 protein [Phytophthora palmivora]|uniref:Retrotransposon 4 protein n=1 Tax=Phytophthora palmivora TaxID=4796 RepID=A0A2P4XVB8_9STRA|nr:Retrotransposon 4 protein [Phytophthora palmivora]
MVKELKAVEYNSVWEVVRLPKIVHVLHTKWVYKANLDAEGLIKWLKARLVACENDQIFGVNYSVTFAAVIDMSSVKLILALTRKWHVPVKHGDVPNAFVKADKGEILRIYIRMSQGMEIPEEILKGLGVETGAEVVPELKKAHYGLKPAGRLWSKLLHSKLVEFGFFSPESRGYMCVLQVHMAGVLIVVGVCVDDFLVIGTQQHAVKFF